MLDKGREAIFDILAPQWGKGALGPPGDAAHKMLEELELEEKTVLDVGAGTGVLVEAGLDQNPGLWVCCDLSTGMLEQIGASWNANPSVDMLHADAHCLPLEDASFDVVICNAVLPHFHNRHLALAECTRVLKQGGQLVINHFIGRERVNQIHRCSDYDMLRGDLLPPADVVAKDLETLGLEVTSIVDSEERYFMLAQKTP